MNDEPLTDENPVETINSDDIAKDVVMPTDFDVDLEPSGPCCEKCGTPLAAQVSLVCQKCGWYASIGSFVEIDRGWEVASNADLAGEDEVIPVDETNIPTWAYILTGCVVAVIIESVAARLLTDGGLRTLWSLTQLFVGFIAFAVCHTYCFARVLNNEADVKLMDYVLRPINTWSSLIRELPERSWACYVGLSGLTAVIMSLLVIGNIPYERLLDWNVKEKAKFNLMGAIMEQAQNNAAEDDKSLEEAIGDFAGKAELDEDAKKKAREDALEKEDCIIVGYMSNQAGEIHTLFLAAEHYAKLKYAGSVRATDLKADELAKLTEQLRAIRTRRSFVKMSISGATWVKPKYLCRVSYRRRGKQGGLYGTKLVDLLGEVQLEK